jgi:putative membrane protein
MMHWGNFGAGVGGFAPGWIFMVLFWVFVILGVAYFVKHIFSGNKRTAGTESVKDILKKRYASGEITKEDYNEKLTFISM